MLATSALSCAPREVAGSDCPDPVPARWDGIAAHAGPRPPSAPGDGRARSAGPASPAWARTPTPITGFALLGSHRRPGVRSICTPWEPSTASPSLGQPALPFCRRPEIAPGGLEIVLLGCPGRCRLCGIGSPFGYPARACPRASRRSGRSRGLGGQRWPASGTAAAMARRRRRPAGARRAVGESHATTNPERQDQSGSLGSGKCLVLLVPTLGIEPRTY